MKISTAFVTNSSSSGYIIIQLNYRNGMKSQMQTEWDSGWGDYFSDYGLDEKLGEAKTGADLLSILRKCISNWESLVDNKPWRAGFCKEIESLSSLDLLKSIRIEEYDRYPEGDNEDYKDYTFQFGKGINKRQQTQAVSSVFADPRSIEPSFSNAMSGIGDFVAPDYREREDHGWKCLADFPYLLKLDASPTFGAQVSPFRFLVVGDNTVKQYNSGDTSVMNEAIKHQKAYGYTIITESDFWSLGDYVPPKTMGIVSSWNEKVSFIGRMTHMSDREADLYIRRLGGFPTIKIENDTDIVVITQDELANRLSNSGITDIACKSYAETGKPVLLSEEAFCEIIAASPAPQQPILLPVKETETVDSWNKKNVAFIGTMERKKLLKVYSFVKMLGGCHPQYLRRIRIMWFLHRTPCTTGGIWIR